MSEPRHIAIATSTRADWGLLSPIAKALAARDDVRVSIIATNMHLDPRYGNTIDEITDDGLTVAATIKLDAKGDSERDKALQMAESLRGTALALDDIKPDALLILGDRYEMLAIASAAAIMRIPIIHIAGGEISEGAIDDSMRHAITKLSALHLVATEPYRQRVIQLGEEPSRVINTGAIGVYNILNEPLLSRAELEASLGFAIPEGTMLVTLHPATLDPQSSADSCQQMLRALDRFPANDVLITYPNSDAGSQQIIEQIEAYAAAQPQRVHVVKSLGRVRYLSALRCVSAVVGNSSSGIVEVPSMGIPTVDIGTRQRGRIAAQSVIHCKTTADEIYRAINYALSAQGQELAAACQNPYYRKNTLESMVKAIVETPLNSLKTKKFYDIVQA